MKPIIGGLFLTGLAAASFATVVTMFDTPQGDKIEAALNDRSKVALAPAPLKPVDLPALAENKPKPQSVDQAIAAISGTLGDTQSQTGEDPIAAVLPFGTDIGGDFDLIDHDGEARQLEDYRGKHVMIFFGYANCLAICSTALPLMADTVTQLGEDAGSKVVPLMITVDPENDTPEFMKKRLGEYHPSLIGMTGSEVALADVRTKFRVRVEHVGDDIEGNPIYNHGSFVYLMGPDGKFQTLMPPILDASQMAKIVKKYIDKSSQQAS